MTVFHSNVLHLEMTIEWDSLLFTRLLAVIGFAYFTSRRVSNEAAMG